VNTVAALPEVVGKGLAEGFLSADEIHSLVAAGLDQLDLHGRRVLAVIPDGTRTMPMPLLFGILEEELLPRVAQLDFLIATGTHRSMSEAELSRHTGRDVVNGIVDTAGSRIRIFNHDGADPAELTTAGVIAGAEIAEITGGLLREDLPVRVNRAILDYHHILICGPVFPHEVAGFSGGTKYFFPGIAGREIVDLTHWLGALITSSDTIGVVDTPVRRVIDRAAAMIPVPHSLIGFVTRHEGVAGLYCGPTKEAWRRAAELSLVRHIVRIPKPAQRVLAIMPEMYTDLWTGAKGMYKSEPAVADGGEVVIYAPHIREVSHMHGAVIREVGYHCRDYFLKQWDRFHMYPGGILAHSTHVKGKGDYNAATGVETPRLQVTLATAIPESVCREINLGYLDPTTVDVDDWRAHEKDGWLVVPRAGELLYRLAGSAMAT
jgi:nickel-dependent lactate racemase